MTNPINDDPVSLNIKPKPAGISKINRLPVVAVFCMFLLLIVFLIFNMSHKQSMAKQKAKSKSEESRVASSDQPVNESWFKDPVYDNLRLAPIQKVPTDSDSTINNSGISQTVPFVSKVTDVSKVSLEPANPNYTLESQKSFNEAVKSVGVTTQSSLGTSISNGFENPYIREGNQGTSGVLVKSDANLNDKERFLKDGILPGDYLPHVLKDVISPYEVKAGTVIPAALEGGLNSDLPGYLRARVRENVYDTVSGKYVLIPQGAVLLGEYQSKVDFGQSRVLVVWTRMIYPNGKSINLEKMSGIDRSGYSGLSDKTNQHWFRLYSSAFLMSVMGAGYELLNKDNNNDDEESSRTIVAAQVGQQLGQVSNEVIRKNLNVSPTIEIRPGHKFYVFVQKDMLLEPWKEYEPL